MIFPPLFPSAVFWGERLDGDPQYRLSVCSMPGCWSLVPDPLCCWGNLFGDDWTRHPYISIAEYHQKALHSYLFVPLLVSRAWFYSRSLDDLVSGHRGRA